MSWGTGRAFNRCLQLIEEQGYAIPDCLALYPSRASELQPLLLLATRIKTTELVTPDPATKADGLIKFRREIERRLAQEWRPSRAKKHFVIKPALRTLFMFLIALLIVATLSSGVAYAIERATPSSSLYPLKLGYQHFRVSLEQDPLQKLRLHLYYVDQRRQEILSLLENKQSSNLKRPLEDLFVHLRSAEEIHISLPPMEKEEIGAQRESLYEKLRELVELLRQQENSQLAPLLDQWALLIGVGPEQREEAGSPTPQSTPAIEERSDSPPLPAPEELRGKEEETDIKEEGTAQPEQEGEKPGHENEKEEQRQKGIEKREEYEDRGGEREEERKSLEENLREEPKSKEEHESPEESNIRERRN